jgi:hypothetical protein
MVSFFALAAWRARRGAKHGAEGEPRKVAAALAATPKSDYLGSAENFSKRFYEALGRLVLFKN